MRTDGQVSVVIGVLLSTAASHVLELNQVMACTPACDGYHGAQFAAKVQWTEWSPSVVSKCANPNCAARMKYLHQGRLFVVPSRSSARYWQKESGSFSAPPGNQIEYHWLCDSCVDQMTVTAEGILEYVPPIPNLSHIEAVDMLCHAQRFDREQVS